MLRTSDKRDWKMVFDYIGTDYARCLYLYLNYERYAYRNDNVRVWIDEDGNGEVTGIFLQYYNCLHIYSREGKRIAADAVTVVAEVSPQTVYTTPEVYEVVRSKLPYAYEPHYMAVVEKLKTSYGIEGVQVATEEELHEVAEFLLTDPVYSGVYTSVDSLERQLRERMQTGYGETYLARKHGKIYFTTSIVAQNEQIVIGSLALLAPEYRGKGLGKRAIATESNLATEKGKRCYGISVESALKLHLDLGYLYQGDIVKLVKQS